MSRFKKLLLTLTIAAAGLGVFAFTAPKAHALSGSEFNPGRIIDDSVFFNKDAMSVNDIQNFIYSKSGNCDTNHATGNSSYQPPWTCLYQYRENTDNHANNIGNPGANPAGSKSASQIIYDAAQEFSISPKVLLVLLQKEQSLLTDNWPYPSQYRGATGMGCPDTAACDSQYYGFYNQVRGAARQYRLYANNPNNYNYKAGRNNNIGYNPNAGCGYQTVYIQNQATAGLYNYTPYVPNAAALNNLYGTGDGCSAYGNRNFWRLFSDWFGSTYGVAYSASFAGQSAYPSIAPGGSSTAYISYKNTGASAWYDDSSRSSGPSGTLPTRLATGNPTNRASDFGSSWTSDKNRPALNFSAVYESNGTTLASNQHVVQPGQIGKFSFAFNVPASQGVGVYQEYFRPVLDGSSDGAFVYDTVWLDVTVSGTYSSAWSSQGSSPTIHPTESYGTYIAYKNTGNIPWFDDLSIYGAPNGTKPVHLATSRTINRSSVFGATWGSDKNRPADVLGAVYEANGTTLASNQHVVQPGQIGKFNINLQTAAQQAAGSFTEYFQPIVEGGTTMNDPDTYLAPSVSSLPSGASTVAPQTIGMTPGETKTYTTSFTNTGNSTWTPSTVFLQPDGASSTTLFRAGNWISTTKVSALNQSSVAPGATGTFNLSITAPSQAGNYAISFAPGNGTTSFGSPNAKFNISVERPIYSAMYAGQSAYPTMLAGGSSAAHISYKNTGNVAWYDDTSRSSGPSGTLPTRLATGNPTNRASVFGSSWTSDRNRPALNFGAVYESNGTTLASDQHVVLPGQIAKFTFAFNTPANAAPGLYREYFRPVLDGSSDGAFSYDNVWLDVRVSQPIYSATYAGQSAYPTIARNGSSAAHVSYKNTGNVAWYDDSSRGSGPVGTLPTRLATGNPTNRASDFGSGWTTDKNRPALIFGAVYEADGATLASDQHIVQPGQIAKFVFTFNVNSSQALGLYREYFRPVLDGSSDGAFSYDNVWLDVRVQ
jgi:hypothetical protein